MALRDIIEIDESKCDGCGQCVTACAEGAIRIVAGKARVVSDEYCDGLGACLGHCPRDAISIVQRVAPPFNHAAVAQHLAAATPNAPLPHMSAPRTCPGTAAMQLHVLSAAPPLPCFNPASSLSNTPSTDNSRLANWPVQLHLVSPSAAYLQGADLLLVADCVPFACADFHSHILSGHPVVIGCPKLDDTQTYVRKLVEIIQTAQLHSITAVHMEVPCCTGLLRIAQTAVHLTGSAIPVHSIMVTIRGQIVGPTAACSV